MGGPAGGMPMGGGKGGGMGGMSGGGMGMSPAQFMSPGGMGGPGGGMGSGMGGGGGMGGPGGGMGGGIKTPMGMPGSGGGIGTPMGGAGAGRSAISGGGGTMSGPQMAMAQAGGQGGPMRGGTTPTAAQMVAQRMQARGPQMASASGGATPARMSPGAMNQPPGMPASSTSPSRAGALSAPMGASPLGPGGPTPGRPGQVQSMGTPSALGGPNQTAQGYRQGQQPGTDLRELSPLGAGKQGIEGPATPPDRPSRDVAQSEGGGQGQEVMSDARDPVRAGDQEVRRRGGRREPLSTQATRATPEKPMITGYVPGAGRPGSATRKMEGGPMGSGTKGTRYSGKEKARPLNTIEAAASGKAPYASIAGRKDQYGMTGKFSGDVGGKTYSDVPVRVEDTGSQSRKYFGPGTNHFDVAHGGNPNAPVTGAFQWDPLNAMQNFASTMTGGLIPPPSGTVGPSMTNRPGVGGPNPGMLYPPRASGSPAGLPPGGSPSRPPGVPSQGGGAIPPRASPAGLPMQARPGGSPPSMPMQRAGGEAAPLGGAPRPPGSAPAASQRAPLPYQTAPERFQQQMGGQPTIPGMGTYDPMRGAVPMPQSRPQGAGAGLPGMSPLSSPMPHGTGPGGIGGGGAPAQQAPSAAAQQAPAPQTQLDQQWANRPQFDYGGQPATAAPPANQAAQAPSGSREATPAPTPQETPQAGSGASQARDVADLDQRIQDQGQRATQENFAGSPEGQRTMQDLAGRTPYRGGAGVPQGAPSPQMQTAQQVMQSMPQGANHERRLQHLNQNAHRLDPQSRQQLQQINRAYQRDRYGLGPEGGPQPAPGYPETLRRADTYRGEYIGPQAAPVGGSERRAAGLPSGSQGPQGRQTAANRNAGLVHAIDEAHRYHAPGEHPSQITYGGQTYPLGGPRPEQMQRPAGRTSQGQEVREGSRAIDPNTGQVVQYTRQGWQPVQSQRRQSGGRGGGGGRQSNPFKEAAKALKPQSVKTPDLRVQPLKHHKRFRAKR